jgi:peptide deformylase
MALREIRIFGDPVLRERAQELEAFGPDLEELVQDMFETMYHASGIGLAAPQIGLSVRVMVVDVPESEEEEGGRFALVNPRIVAVDEQTERAPEGCLSIPGLEEIVERPATVVVEGSDPAGARVTVRASGLLSRALQHEIDHLDGVLFLDRVSALKRRMLVKKWKKAQAEAATP